MSTRTTSFRMIKCTARVLQEEKRMEYFCDDDSSDNELPLAVSVCTNKSSFQREEDGGVDQVMMNPEAMTIHLLRLSVMSATNFASSRSVEDHGK